MVFQALALPSQPRSDLGIHRGCFALARSATLRYIELVLDILHRRRCPLCLLALEGGQAATEDALVQCACEFERPL